jgi:hypothetical protein
MRAGEGPWVKMTKVVRQDPAIAALEYASDCSHMWQANMPAGLTPGAHVVEVRTTDMFGQTYTGRRIIRVVEGKGAGAE